MYEIFYDVLIIGGGPAGVSSAIYSARKKISTAIVVEKFGGQLLGSSSVENFLGFEDETGIDLNDKFVNHLKKYENDISIFEKDRILSIKKTDDLFYLKSAKRKYIAKTVIIATGRTSKKLGIEGEDNFAGRGVVYCATCDAPMFIDQDVVVVGGGNSAVDAVIQLLDYANKIYLVDIAKELIADKIFIDKIKKSDKVEIFNSSKIEKIEGDNFVSSVIINRACEFENLIVDGIFVEIGSSANSSFIDDYSFDEKLLLDSNKDIIIDKMCKTNIDGLFAAGDVTDVFGKQAIISAGEGSKAALAVYKYLKLES